MKCDPDLVEQLYAELKKRAAKLVTAHVGSVAPSSLVHEVLLRLWRQEGDRWESKAHFRAVAAKAMRQVLVDRARKRGAVKRGGGLLRVHAVDLIDTDTTLDLVAFHQALERLAEEWPRCAQVVELRLLGGMDVKEVCTWLDVSPSTVKREWRMGRAFLISELQLS